MSRSLAELRREYRLARLDVGDLAQDPVAELERWLAQALEAQLVEPYAMTLATATPDGAPSARIVLLRGVDAQGLTFFTDYRSRKAQELAANPRAALCFYWGELERQVRVTGTVEQVSREESAAYFATRPRGSQLGAWASTQSSVLATRDELERRWETFAAQYPAEVPLPAHWGGYRLRPERFEFWQGRESRLHDRFLYVKDGEKWRVERLSP